MISFGGLPELIMIAVFDLPLLAVVILAIIALSIYISKNLKNKSKDERFNETSME